MPRIRSASPVVAAFLSFLFPGLGQAAAGRYKRGIVFALPALAGALGALAAAIDPRSAIAALLDPGWLTLFLAVDLLALAYHVWSIVDAYQVAGGALAMPPRTGVTPRRAAAAAAVFVLVAGAIGVHGYVAANDRLLQETLGCVFNTQGPVCLEDLAAESTPTPHESATAEPTAAASPTEFDNQYVPVETVVPGGTPTFPTPAPTKTSGGGSKIPVYPVEPMPPSIGTAKDWAKDGWLNVVLVGSDAGVGRWSLRTDIMILLRVDLSTGRAAMFGIPRNVYNVPLAAESAKAFACHCFPYPNMLNALYRYAMDHPAYFPGGTYRGFYALEGAIGALTNVHVDGSIVINLMGYVKLVNALGGVKISVPYRVTDASYVNEYGVHEPMTINAGSQKFDGHHALFYARSRHQDSDYGRMARQQILLKAMRSTVVHPCTAVDMSALLAAIKSTFWTDLPLSDAGKLLNIAEHVGSANTAGYTFVPPTYPEFYTLAIVTKIRSTVAHGLDKVSGTGDVSGGASC